MTVEENISNGKKALQSIIKNHKDVKNAMRRDDIGNIDFIWGIPGNGTRFKHGYGLSHIIAKRDFETGDGVEVANKLVEVIAKGSDIDRQNASHGSGEYRIRIHFDEFTAVLSAATEERNSWLLTGWENTKVKSHEKKKAMVNARGEGNDSSTATAATPTLTRRSGETIAVANSNIPQIEPASKEK